MPKAIYCIHALSLYLFKLGVAPQIQDLYGKIDFTAEEIDNVRMELEKYGIQMPAFGKIGGLLTSQLSVDEAMLHAAVIAVNEAVDRGVASDTLTAMQNPNAMLLGLDKSLSELYQEALSQVKGNKASSAQNTLMTAAEREMYDDLLTHAEIQGNVNQINLLSALEVVEDAIERGDVEGLFAGLQCPNLGLSGLCHENALCYLQKLSDARQCKIQRTDSLEPLNKDELQAVLMAANGEAWRHELSESLLSCGHVVRLPVKPSGPCSAWLLWDCAQGLKARSLICIDEHTSLCLFRCANHLLSKLTFWTVTWYWWFVL
uniref:Uncharacterized protein n=1 Tax=Eptatretus burgeri TaxID=7764 RepID=A0A8C4QXK5_EPTBU